MSWTECANAPGCGRVRSTRGRKSPTPTRLYSRDWLLASPGRLTDDAGIHHFAGLVQRDLNDCAGSITDLLHDLTGGVGRLIQGVEAEDIPEGFLVDDFPGGVERFLDDAAGGIDGSLHRLSEGIHGLREQPPGCCYVLESSSDSPDGLTHDPAGLQSRLPDLADRPDGLIHTLQESGQKLGIAIDRGERAIENRGHIVEANDQVYFSLHAFDGELYFVDADISAGGD